LLNRDTLIRQLGLDLDLAGRLENPSQLRIFMQLATRDCGLFWV
jgi:hypothetical protein